MCGKKGSVGVVSESLNRCGKGWSAGVLEESAPVVREVRINRCVLQGW